jgi:hypothetical protein
MAEKLIPKQRLPISRTEAGNIKIKGSYLTLFARAVTVIFATLFPSISIIVLYYISSLVARLWTILGFSFLFATTVAIFTTASLAEIFGVTAA